MTQPITSTVLWNLNGTSSPFDAYYESQIIEFSSSASPLDPFSAEEEPSLYRELWSRDHVIPTHNGFLANREQTFNLLDPASNLGLASPIDTDTTLPGDAYTLLAGPNVIDWAEPCQWTNDDGWDASLLPLVPRHSNHKATFQYRPGRSAMTHAAPGFQRNADHVQDLDETNHAQHLHIQVQGEQLNVCQECKTQFRNKTALDGHAKQTQHAPYLCLCGVTFSRFDVMNRHLDKFSPKTLHPCPYCSRFSGFEAFPRRDHLTQHLRNFHNIDISDGTQDSQSFAEKRTARNKILSCPHEGCVYHSQTAAIPPNPPGNQDQIVFRKRQEFTKHLREVHNESLFPCNILGCDRTGGRGFFRKRDLLKHRKGHGRESMLDTS